MLPAIIAIAFMAAPAGYLAGEVYREMNPKSPDWMPMLCAMVLPFAAIISIIVINQAEQKENENE